MFKKTLGKMETNHVGRVDCVDAATCFKVTQHVKSHSSPEREKLEQLQFFLPTCQGIFIHSVCHFTRRTNPSSQARVSSLLIRGHDSSSNLKIAMDPASAKMSRKAKARWTRRRPVLQDDFSPQFRQLIRVQQGFLKDFGYGLTTEMPTEELMKRWSTPW